MSIGQQNKSSMMFYGAIALVVVLVAGLFFMNMRGKTTSNTMVTYNLTPESSLAKPFLTDEEIIQFAARASADIMTFEYETYKEDLQETRGDFTDQGWINIQEAFKQSGMLNHVVDQEMDVNSIVTTDPKIVEEGVVNGVYTWLVEAPFLMVYSVSGDTIEERMNLTLRIHRSDSSKNADHVGITQIVIAPQ